MIREVIKDTNKNLAYLKKTMQNMSDLYNKKLQPMKMFWTEI